MFSLALTEKLEQERTYTLSRSNSPINKFKQGSICCWECCCTYRLIDTLLGYSVINGVSRIFGEK